MAIGQKQSTIANVVRKLEENGALANTIVVAASASESAALQYLGAVLRLHHGANTSAIAVKTPLIVYDDLSKQAVAYRQISCCCAVRRAAKLHPGDVFYLHSRLLERASRVSEEYVEKFTNGAVTGKTGSLTALPIIEVPGRRRFRVRSDQRDLDHRRPDLPGIRHVQLGYPSGRQRRYLGIPRRWRGPDQDHQEAVRRHPYRSGPVP